MSRYVLKFVVKNPQGYGYGESSGMMEFHNIDHANDTGRKYSEWQNNRRKNVLVHDVWEFVEAVQVA